MADYKPSLKKLGPDIKKTGLLFYIPVVAISVLTASFETAFSLALGGALTLFNLAMLEKWLMKALSPSSTVSAAKFIVLFSFYIRFMITGAVILGFHIIGWVNFPGLLAGLSIPLLASALYIIATFDTNIEEGHERAY